VDEDGGDVGDPIGGYSILQAESDQALAAVLDGHPHVVWGGTIEITRALPMPGMWTLPSGASANPGTHAERRRHA